LADLFPALMLFPLVRREGAVSRGLTLAYRTRRAPWHGGHTGRRVIENGRNDMMGFHAANRDAAHR
jgi:hypothetical protein